MELPYHCPTFRTEHLVDPCQKNLARVKALQEAHKHVGPLEKCVECKGKALITAPRTVIEGLPAPENWVEEQFVNQEPKEYVSPERKGWEPHPEVTTAPVFLKDVGEKEDPNEVEITKKPNWPEMKTLPPEKVAAGRVAGHNLGKKYKKREKAVPAVKLTEKEAAKLGITIVEVPRPTLETVIRAVLPDDFPDKEMLQAYPDPPAGARYCPTHPDVLQRIDKLGRWMGMCDPCLSARGKKCGEQNFERGTTAPPMFIPLNLSKYAELKVWLQGQAEENERALAQEIMFILKMVRRNYEPTTT